MKILAIGEVMMRLTPPDYKMIEQSTTLDLTFSGTGLNILSGLARNGFKTSLLTSVPNNSVGKASSSFIRKLGVNDEYVNFSGNHIGTYFLEQGFGNRPSQVTYLNRSESSFCREKIPKNLLVDSIDTHDTVHVCGIALSTSKVSRQLILDAVELAFNKKKKIIFDFNYRPSLNEEINDKELLSDYRFILERSFMVFGSSRDISHLYGISDESEENLVNRLFTDFSHIQYFSGTQRGNGDTLSGVIFTRDEVTRSTEKKLTIFDRIGTGDAYAVGIILGVLREWPLKETVEFATTYAELSHTTFGDTPILDETFIKKYMDQPNMRVFR